MNTSLEQAFEKYHQILSRKDFSRYILTQTGRELHLFIPIDEVVSVYSHLHKCVEKESQDFEFIWRGKNHAKKLQDEGKEHMRFTANTMNRLEKLLTEHQVPMPLWLPRTFSELNETFDFIPHRRVYFFLWNTVQPQFIGFQNRTSVEMYIRRFAANVGVATEEDCDFADDRTPTALNSNPALNDLKNNISEQKNVSKDDNKVADEVPELPGCDNQDNNKAELALDLSAAEHFLRLHEASKTDGEVFQLRLEDIQKRLTQPQCDISGLPLSFNEKEGHTPWITLNNESSGYHPGNLKTCATPLVDLKDKMNDDEFAQVINTMNLLKSKNMDYSFLFNQ